MTGISAYLLRQRGGAIGDAGRAPAAPLSSVGPRAFTPACPEPACGRYPSVAGWAAASLAPGRSGHAGSGHAGVLCKVDARGHRLAELRPEALLVISQVVLEVVAALEPLPLPALRPSGRVGVPRRRAARAAVRGGALARVGVGVGRLALEAATLGCEDILTARGARPIARLHGLRMECIWSAHKVRMECARGVCAVCMHVGSVWVSIVHSP